MVQPLRSNLKGFAASPGHDAEWKHENQPTFMCPRLADMQGMLYQKQKSKQKGNNLLQLINHTDIII